tara:strand:+ start:581 stop:1288 length:708 start_codon:yes stop_codon:yes gene_type:complete
LKINSNKIVCIIPARAGSKRLKEKNFLKLKNKMLIEYTIQAAIDSKIFKYIVISTDFKKIFSLKKKYNSIEILERPQKLRTDKSTVDEVCLDILKRNKFYQKCDYICVLYPTAILRTDKDISNAFKKFTESKSSSLIGVKEASIPHKILKLKNGYLKKYFKGQNIHIKTNKYLNQFFIDNGSMYFAKMTIYLRQKTFFGKGLIGYKMDDFKSIDIDYKENLDKIKLILRKKIVRL